MPAATTRAAGGGSTGGTGSSGINSAGNVGVLSLTADAGGEGAQVGHDVREAAGMDLGVVSSPAGGSRS